MRKIRYFASLIVIMIISTNYVYSQGVGINDNGVQPNASAMLDVASANKGVLFPRITTNQMLNINAPANGLIIFNTDSLTFCYYNGSAWICLCVSPCESSGTPPVANAGTDITICTGDSTILTAGGGDTYIWSTLETTVSITVKPVVTNTYTVTATNAYGTDSDNVIVTVSIPVANAGADITITSGQTTTLTATGGVSYVWNTGSTSDTTIVTPATNTTYTVTATDVNGCTDSDDVVVTVNSSTCGIINDIRDGKTYNTIIISGSSSPYCLGASQCWMAENLDVGFRIDSINTQTNNGLIEKYCYSDNPVNCTLYGGLYTWYEMMAYGVSVGGNGPGPQGICPAGWHLPTDNEWKCLEMNLGLSQIDADASTFRGITEGGDLKEAGTTNWTAPNTGATNNSGFTALPSGWFSGGSYTGIWQTAYFWSSTENSANNAWLRYLGYNNSQILRYFLPDKADGFSVRCVKD